MYESIDPYELADAVRAIAEEQPDHIYERPLAHSGKCFYTTETGEPDCIIGVAMARIGQPLPPQSHDIYDEHEGCPLLDNGVGEGPWHTAFGGELDKYGYPVNFPPVTRWLREVQSNQDGGETWGDSVRSADAKHPYSKS